MSTPTLREALQELRRRSPLMLDATTVQKVDGAQKEQPMKFADDHLFAIVVPAWALRAIVAGTTPKLEDVT